jgi:pimeloyl-ACP methyl ester carboxylesterase
MERHSPANVAARASEASTASPPISSPPQAANPAAPLPLATQAWAAIAKQLDADAARVAAGTLQPACACFFVPAKQAAAQGVVVMLHGFTAGPWQYANLADHLAAAGLHCYAARLPGHGARAADGRSDGSELPKSHQGELYSRCAAQALADAEALAQQTKLPLYAVGFSAGAALTIDLLQRHPDKITRAVLISPLVRFKGRLHHALFHSLVRIPLSGRLTNRLRLAWEDPPVAPGGWIRPGHGNFVLGNVQGLAAYTGRVHRRRAALDVPCQFILTGSDAKIDLAAAVALARRGPKPHSLWCFPKRAGLPHALLTPYENPDATSREHIYRMAADFLLRGWGHDQAPA